MTFRPLQGSSSRDSCGRRQERSGYDEPGLSPELSTCASNAIPLRTFTFDSRDGEGSTSKIDAQLDFLKVDQRAGDVVLAFVECLLRTEDQLCQPSAGISAECADPQPLLRRADHGHEFCQQRRILFYVDAKPDDVGRAGHDHCTAVLRMRDAAFDTRRPAWRTIAVGNQRARFQPQLRECPTSAHARRAELRPTLFDGTRDMLQFVREKSVVLQPRRRHRDHEP